MAYSYEVRFHVVGVDHWSYCYDKDAEDENERIEVDEFKTKWIRRAQPVNVISDLDFYNDRCVDYDNAVQSGYCRGYGQTWQAVQVLSLKTTDETFNVEAHLEKLNKSRDEETE